MEEVEPINVPEKFAPEATAGFLVGFAGESS